MSSSTSNNGLIQKNGGFAITLAKMNKPVQDPFEINSINSAILLNPTTIKTNHPIINHLYTPILGQARSDTIDLSAISINTFSNNNINPLLLNSFQNLQPNKFHPYIRSNANNLSNPTVIKNRSNNYRSNGQSINSQQSTSNSTGTSTSSTSSNYLVHNLRLSEELNSNLAQNLIKQNVNSYPTADSSRLINDSSLNNWLINGQNQLNHSNNNQYLSTNSSHLLSSRNQLNKRSRVGNNNKNSLYSDKNAVDSVKKLDKILLTHNKNLQEIIRHKNQLIDQLNRRSNNSSSQLNNHQSPVNRVPISKQQLNYQQQTSLVNTNGNSANSSKTINKTCYPNGNSIANLSNNLIYSQLSNNINQQINQLNQLHNSAKLILNNNKKSLRTNNSESNLINGLNGNLVFNNNSLSVLTRAINEEAELNKQKQEMNNQIEKPIEFDKGKQTNAETIANNVSNAANDLNQAPIVEQVQQKRELVSKLDEREIRLKRIREEEPNDNEIFFINNGDLEDYFFGDELEECLTDIELDDEYDYRLQSMSTIFNTGKSSPNLTEEKLSFLNLIGLTTEENKEKLEFEKFIRTKRNLKEISNVDSNVNENSKSQSSRSQTLRSYSTRNQSRLLKEANKDNNTIKDYDFGNQILTKSKDLDDLADLPDKSDSFDIFNEFISSIANRKIDNIHLKPSEVSPLNVRDSSNDQKLNFMDQIGLIIENDVENIKSKEFFWNGVLDDRERRKIFQTCFEDLTDNLDPSTKQRWLSQLSEQNLNERAHKGASCKSKGSENSVNSVHVGKDVNVYQRHRNSNKLSRELEIKSTNLINQQSSNESSLIPFTDGLLITVKMNEQNTVSRLNTSDELLDHADYIKKQDQSFRWQGVESVIKSYHEFISETEIEKLRLSGKFQAAQENKVQKIREIEELKKKRSRLIKDKNDLISDEIKIRNAFKESYYSTLKKKFNI